MKSHVRARPGSWAEKEIRQANSLAFSDWYAHRFGMGLPNEPVTLTPEQVEALNQHLSKMRHDINNHLSLIVFAVEVLRSKPEMIERMLTTLGDQPAKISSDMVKFSSAFEETFGIVRQ